MISLCELDDGCILARGVQAARERENKEVAKSLGACSVCGSGPDALRELWNGRQSREWKGVGGP